MAVPPPGASLQYPTGVAVDRDANVFIADAANHRIRRIDAEGTISTVAGTGIGAFGGDGGPATAAYLKNPTEVLLDGEQNLLIADSGNGRVRRVDADGTITTIAGGGSEAPTDGVPATSVSLSGGPCGMAFDGAGSVLVCEEYGHRVWRLTPTES